MFILSNDAAEQITQQIEAQPYKDARPLSNKTSLNTIENTMSQNMTQQL